MKMNMQAKVPTEPKLIRELNSVLSRLKIHTFDFQKPINTEIKMPPFEKESQRLAFEYLHDARLVGIKKRPRGKSGSYVFSIPNNAALKAFTQEISVEYELTKSDHYLPKKIETGCFYIRKDGSFFKDGAFEKKLMRGKYSKSAMDYMWERRHSKVIFLKDVGNHLGLAVSNVRQTIYRLENTLGYGRGKLFEWKNGLKGWAWKQSELST